ncbi:MAG TPA: adenylate kinase [Anaerolineae bacterium]|nr:adenylate kinase [Anaerolineae bacterium]HID84692.1 adenylate kinase [Anaerolineales bacterium]HIQ09447.1 adenylate kinase [Anaerolineaceae bacterium]
MPTYIVLLGAPGAGKGTQAKILAQKTGLPHISSGDIFREHLKNDTELGRLARQYMERGALVPDDVTIAMIRERLSRPDCARGAILDGFPRTPAQADALDEMLREWNAQVDVVPFIQVPEEELVSRLAGRWICRAQGHIFHEKFNPPKQPGVCDYDGSELYQRSDDRPEVVRERIRVYYQQTAPLAAYYRERGLLREVDGTQSIEQVTQTLLSLLPPREDP